VSMLTRSGYQAYQRNKYETASPHKLILLLYDGALTNIARAKQAIEGKNIAEANRFILKSQDIVNELLACLNEERGGEIAQNLKRLYFYVNRILVQANIRKQIEPLVEAETILADLRDTWEKIGKVVGTGAT